MVIKEIMIENSDAKWTVLFELLLSEKSMQIFSHAKSQGFFGYNLVLWSTNICKLMYHEYM